MKFGITERGDAGVDFSWTENLHEGNIIISKALAGNQKLIDALIENKDKVIFHCTCTGFGGTVLEPKIPKVRETVESMKILLERFPAKQVVLRVDPIIPTEKGIKTAKKVIEAFSELEIPRIRFSWLDMYNHVKERFAAAGIDVPYESFNAPKEMQQQAEDEIVFFATRQGFMPETCGEHSPYATGCISKTDLKILKLDAEIEGNSNQRPYSNCKCPSCKKELLAERSCPFQCLYCFWR